MKKRIPTFLAGMATMALICSFGIGALAATGAFTITVDPINIQVNGATFSPKDAQGNSVPVFAYNGTTYAPLRALAEAYGLEVGYDAGKNMATVGEKAAAPATTPAPDTALSDDYSTWTAEEEAAYQEFKGMWEVSDNSTESNGVGVTINASYTGGMSKKQFIDYVSSRGEKLLNLMLNRFCCDTIDKYSNYEKIYFAFDFERKVFVGASVKQPSFQGAPIETTIKNIEKLLIQ